MAEDKNKKISPPYVSYRTFNNFIEDLQSGIPARIDRSYWGARLSGSTGTQLVAAMRFLGLIDENGVPTNALRELVPAKGSQKSLLLRRIANNAYRHVLEGSFNPLEGTHAQLEECFRNQYQLNNNDVMRKCIKFFLSFSYSAEIQLSPFIQKRSGAGKRTKTATSARTKKVLRVEDERTNNNSIIPKSIDEMPKQNSWEITVLSKFPNFDPSWSAEMQMKWFDAYNRLLDIHNPGDGANNGNGH